MGQIYVPSTRPEDWRIFLKDPQKHWKTGFSAKALAYCWHDADGLPLEIQKLFDSSDLAPLRSIQPLLVIPERITAVAGKGEPPHSDVFVLGKSTDQELVSITIEGKVNEAFGKQNQSVHQWKFDGDLENRQTRLDFLLKKLSITEDTAQDIAYQLIQRTASSVVEAETFNAKHAVMIVQSFSPDNAHWEIFRTFVKAFGQTIERGQLLKISEYDDISISVGWAQGDLAYLSV